MTAGVSQPRHRYRSPTASVSTPVSEGLDGADALVARDERDLGLDRPVAARRVDVGVDNPLASILTMTCRVRPEDGELTDLEGCSELGDHGGLHDCSFGRVRLLSDPIGSPGPAGRHRGPGVRGSTVPSSRAGAEPVVSGRSTGRGAGRF